MVLFLFPFEPATKLVDPLVELLGALPDHPIVGLSVPELSFDSTPVKEPSRHQLQAFRRVQSRLKLYLDNALAWVLWEELNSFDRAES